MRTIRRMLCVAFLSALFFGVAARAQQAPAPAVQVDLSVLDPSLPPSPYAAPPPAQRPARPSLTAQTPAVEAGRPPPRQQPRQISSPPPPARETRAGRTSVMFPVTVRDSSEQYDPSLEKTTPTAAKAVSAPAKQKITANPPLPPMKPVAIAARPAIVKKKIPALPLQKSAEKKEPPPLQIKGAAIMPAVPSQTVQAERLGAANAPASGDDLASQLSTPDKVAMVRSIEAITAMAGALSPALDVPIRKIPAQPLRAAAVPIPSHKPERPPVRIAAKTESAPPTPDRLAAVAPAAGGVMGMVQDLTEPYSPATQASIPRSPPEEDHEQAYITLPFADDSAQLDKKSIKNLEDNILPLLRNNQGWRVQIQAFAGKTKDSAKDPRRLSLSRALAVRTYLMDNGIEARRMDVRALGAQTDRTPADRVDFVFFDPEKMG